MRIIEFAYRNDPDGSRAVEIPVPPTVVSYAAGHPIPRVGEFVSYRGDEWEVVDVVHHLHGDRAPRTIVLLR